jgi:hypothetical protein
MEYEVEHLREMRSWLTLAAGSIESKPMVVDSAIPPLVKQAKIIAETVEEIGLERLSLLMNDRSAATIILENCNTLNKKIEDADWDTCCLIAEAFSKIFENVSESRFNLSGLSEGQRFILKGNVQVLKENFASALPVLNKHVLMEKIIQLVSKWEDYRETQSNAAYAEGVEYGLMLAASELKNLYNEVVSDQD